MNKQLLNPPLPSEACPDFPIVQYADGTLIIMQACQGQLFCLKALLNTFADSTGLKVNYNKSFMVPINASDEKKMDILTKTLNC